MAQIFRPPEPLTFPSGVPSVFLAGSIDMGTAEPWQTEVEVALAERALTIFNPRRLEWDASWKQTITNPQFREQVEWELDALERCSFIAMYFAPKSQAPVTLLEFGLFARSGKLIVCSPPGYWRRGNLEVVCARYGVPLLDELPQLIEAIRERVEITPK
jgi:hypothetical protein